MTKKKLFKNKFVYILNLIFTSIAIILFSSFLISFLGTVSYGEEEIFTDILAKNLGIIVLIFSLISFFMLIGENKKSILLLNLNNLFVCFFFILALYISLKEEGIDGIKEIIIFILLFSLFGFNFLLINNFKYKSINNEIEEIGQNEN